MPTIVEGSEQVVRTQAVDATFGVSTIVCASCGTSTDYKDTDTTCAYCHKPLDRAAMYKKARDISKGEVADILSKTIMWQCQTCKKESDKPGACCLTEFAYTPEELNPPSGKKGSIPAFRCSECAMLYKRKVVCHSGAMMVFGRVQQNMNHHEMMVLQERLQSTLGTYQPVTGVIQ